LNASHDIAAKVMSWRRVGSGAMIRIHTTMTVTAFDRVA
jgi:hypothetical protein